MKTDPLTSIVQGVIFSLVGGRERGGRGRVRVRVRVRATVTVTVTVTVTAAVTVRVTVTVRVRDTRVLMLGHSRIDDILLYYKMPTVSMLLALSALLDGA